MLAPLARIALEARCLPLSLADEERVCSLVRPGQRRAILGAGSRRLEVTEGTDEAFLGNVGDEYAVLEEAAGREPEATRGGR